jgi:hypothetical protein
MEDESSKEETDNIPIPVAIIKTPKKIEWKISIPDALEYGFKVIRGVALPILGNIFLFFMYFFLIDASGKALNEDVESLSEIYFVFAWVALIAALLLTLVLSIGLAYKFGSDILLKAVETHNRVALRKEKK